MKHALETLALVVAAASVGGTIVFFASLGLLELEWRWKAWRRARRGRRVHEVDMTGVKPS